MPWSIKKALDVVKWIIETHGGNDDHQAWRQICAYIAEAEKPSHNTGSPKLPGVKKYLEWADKREIRKTGHRLTQSDLALLEAGYKFIARQLRADA